ncbi:hypothetical protein [Erwinia sp. PsM31]|uniref:hypothetical protein n=1 Tax=Erwinia sp. PsM31 TaxID=3030535 RepID=UPI00263A887E|nr:hypothetical protein [Erwinia sp. PsM31]MDN4627833.1 hypothetical protein [Erwinia sp. PsM31]
MSNMSNSGFHTLDYSIANRNAPTDNGKTTGVINTADYASPMARNNDAQVTRKPFQGRDADLENSEVIKMLDGTADILQVNGTDLNGKGLPGGNDSTAYIQALEESLNATFNDGEFEAAVREHIFPCEFRPYGTKPTPLRTHTMEDRSVILKKNGLFNPAEDAPTAKAIKGSAVMVSPLLVPNEDNAQNTGAFISAATFVSDFEMMGGYTHGALVQSVDNMIDQYNRLMFGKVAEVLAATPDLQTATYSKLTGKPADQAEDVLDALALNLPVHLGGSLDQFALMVPAKLEAVLERAAQRAGHEDLSDLLGCTVCPYVGEDTGVYLLPKLFASISFRTTQEGDAVRVIVSRDSGRAGYNLELVSVIDVLASGTVRVKESAHMEVEADASFPLVHRITFTE